jgi:tetratricopeptide (TPR) repeat protein
MNYFEKSDKELWQEAVDKGNSDRIPAVKALASRLGIKGKHSESMALLETTLSTIDPKSETHEWLDLTFLVCNTNCDLHQYEHALELHVSCLPIAREAMDVEMVAWHARNAALCKSRLKIYDSEWLAYLDEACCAADDSGDPHLRSHIHNTARFQYYYGREFEKSLASAKIFYEYWSDRDDTDTQAFAALCLGTAYVYDCDVENADKYLREAVSLAKITDNEITLQTANISMGKLELLRGNLDAARKKFKKAASAELVGRNMEEAAAEALYCWAVVTRDHFKAKKGQKKLDLVLPAIKKFDIEHWLVPVPGV